MAGKDHEKKHSMFDLFAGCGGLSTGMEQANFEPLLVNELNEDAMATYLANRDHLVGPFFFKDRIDLHYADVHHLTQEAMEGIWKMLSEEGLLGWEWGKRGSNLDLICGGPPCQGYSGIGHRRSYSVEKKEIPSNQLYIKMKEVIDFFKPRIFLFENVKGLLTARWDGNGKKGEIWENVRNEFEKLTDYTVRWSLVKAKDYGVPQNRPRVLLVGIRNDILSRTTILEPDNHTEDAIECGFLPAPEGIAPNPEELLSDLVDSQVKEALLTQNFPSDFSTKTYLHPPKNEIQRKLRLRNGKLMKKGSELTEQEYSKHGAKIVEKFQHMLENNGEIPEKLKTKKFAQRVIPRKWGKDGPNITATSLADDYVHYEQPRALTVREWARLQMFPDWYEFKGIRTTGGLRRAGNPRVGNFDREVPKYTQIGNAVPVELARKVGEHFRNILEH